LRATQASFSFTAISVALILGVTSIVPSHGSVPGSLGTGDCVQQVTGMTGSVTREGNDCLVAFKSGSGTWIVPNGVNYVDYLLVGGGGGGGGGGQPGGGGGGAMVEATALSVSPGEAIALTVGTGGAAGSAAAPTAGSPGGAGSNGLESIFGNLTAFGGGGGSSSGQAVSDLVIRAVSPGGSGGGDVASPVGVAKTSTNSTTVVTEFGTSIPAGTAGLGSRNSGGRAKGVFQNFTGQNLAVSFWVGAGGGGAGQPGEDAFFISDGTFAGTGLRAGNGGNGLPSSILSSSTATRLGVGQTQTSGRVYFAGGGGGRANFDSSGSWLPVPNPISPYALFGSGGLGAPHGAVSNTGGGGLGRSPGGSGVVVIRYVIPQATSLAANASSSTTMNLTWLAPSISETVIGYRVEKSLTGANDWSSAGTTPNASLSSSTSTTVTGLSANTAYDFRVTPIFASGDGITSLVASGSTPKNPQVITWGASNTRVLLESSPLTPSSLATTSGDGPVTYSIQNSGSTSCSVDSSSGILTFSAVGSCVVRAAAAETSAYAAAFKDVTFTISIPGSGRVPGPRVDRPSGASSSVSSGQETAQGESFEVEPRQSFTLTGSSLDSMTVATVGGVKARIVKNNANSLTVRIPKALPAGTYDLELSGSRGKVVEPNFFIVPKKRNAQVIPGFLGNSSEMTNLMKKSTRNFLRTLSGQVSMICVGSSSNTITTSFDRALATKRAREACDFARAVNPGLETSIRIRPASSLGPKARNVRLILRNH